MSFDELWESLCCKKPALRRNDAAVNIRADRLKSLLRQVYDRGKRESPGNLFNSLFGTRRV